MNKLSEILDQQKTKKLDRLRDTRTTAEVELVGEMLEQVDIIKYND